MKGTWVDNTSKGDIIGGGVNKGRIEVTHRRGQLF
jgi:hypothetical protein